jgi:hypothetical protein
MPLRRPDEELAVGSGPMNIGYDRAGVAGVTSQADAPSILAAAQGEPEPTAPTGLAGFAPPTEDTSQLSDEDLAAMAGEDPDEEAVAEMMAALEDPNTPPEQKAILQRELMLAAQRQAAGLGGM